MDAPWLLALGLAVLVAVTIDQFVTIVSTGPGSGFLVPRLTAGLWRLALVVNHRWRSDRMLAVVGITLVVLVPLTWIIGLWLGWSLVFLAEPSAVIDSTSRVPVDAADRVYFAGFSLFTLGVGDFVAGTDPWRLASVLAAVMGLGMITLAITYLVPVVQAATERRQLARTLRLIDDEYGPGDVEELVDRLDPTVTQLTRSTEQHMTYHTLRSVHAVDPELSLPVRLDSLLRRIPAEAASSSEARVVRRALEDLARALADSQSDGPQLRDEMLEMDGRIPDPD